MKCSKYLVSGVILLLFLFAAGCANTRTRMMVDSMEPLMEKMNLAVNKHTDVEMVKDAMPAGLLQLDGLIEASPNNSKILVKAAEGYNGYSFVFVEGKDNERAKKLYLRSLGYSLRALKQKKKFADAFDGPIEEFKASLDVFDKEDVPALFWASAGWLSWVGLNVDEPEIFLAMPKIKAMLNRCIEIDETYKYGMAHAVLGILYAARPEAYGGKPEMAKAELDRALELSDRKMLVYLYMYAKHYCYQIQDKALCEKILNEVISAPDDLFPEMGFINTAAKIKAKKLLSELDEIY